MTGHAPAPEVSLPIMPISVAAPRKLQIDVASFDQAGGLATLMQVYLDGYKGLVPFIKYFPIPIAYTPPDCFKPQGERKPRWETKRLGERWQKRSYVVFEVCIQAEPLQQAVNARAVKFERDRKDKHEEEARRSKTNKRKFLSRKVGMDLRTAASKVAGLLQAAIQSNKKKSCHPQSIATLSSMFRDLLIGKRDAMVHWSSTDPTPQRLPASSVQGCMCIASSSDIDAMVAELYI